jgi:hypothetical protein
MLYFTKEQAKRGFRAMNKRGSVRKSVSRHFRVQSNSQIKIDDQIERWVTESLKEHHEAYEYLKS